MVRVAQPLPCTRRRLFMCLWSLGIPRAQGDWRPGVRLGIALRQRPDDGNMALKGLLFHFGIIVDFSASFLVGPA